MDRKVEPNHPLLQPITEAIFEVHSRDGHTWKIYENGKIEGFPRDVWIVNNIFLRLCSLRSGIMYPDTVVVPGQGSEPVR